MRCKDAEFFGIELARLAHQLAQYLVTNGLRGFQFAAPFTHRTRLAQHMGQRLARALACHFHQSQLRETVDRHAGTVACQRLAKLVEHGVAVLLGIHIDEVDNDNAAEITQPQLARDHLRGLEIGFEYRIVKAAHADKAAGVDIHRGQRFSLIDDQISTRF